MFPCNSNSNYQPFPSTYYDDENPYSSHHQYNNYAYPSLLEDDGVILSYLLSQQQQEHLLLNAPSGTTSTCQAQISVVASNQDLQPLMDTHAYKTSNNMSTNIDNGGDASTKAAEVPARKRRTGKKDRHSKICTAQGPRDRRMRLSLPIARNFFDLQEMLGFDKASKTIEWLFTKSKTAITELKQHLSQGLAQSSSSNKTIATRTTANAKPNNSFTTSTESSEVVSNVSKKKMMVMRKFCTVAKESRAEARARARERTKEKMRIRSSSISSGGGCFDDHHPHQVNPNHFCTTQQMTNCAENHTRSHQLFGANSEEEEEEDEFPGFHGNLGINNSKMQSTSILPYTTSNNSNALQLNPSSILINPNSSFLNTDSAQDQNAMSVLVHSSCPPIYCCSSQQNSR